MASPARPRPRPTTAAAARLEASRARLATLRENALCALRGAGARDVRAAAGGLRPTTTARRCPPRSSARAWPASSLCFFSAKHAGSSWRAGASARDARRLRPPPRRRGAGGIGDGGARGRRGTPAAPAAPADVAYDEAPSDDDAAVSFEARDEALAIRCRVVRAPGLEGLCDGRSLRALLATVKPRALVALPGPDGGARRPRSRPLRASASRRGGAAHVATPAAGAAADLGAWLGRAPLVDARSRARAPAKLPAPSL